MIKITAKFLVFYIILFSGLLFFTHGQSMALSCLLGGLLLSIIFAGFYFGFQLIVVKKAVALGVSTIIFKYLVLGLILLGLSKFEWLDPVGFIAGISTFVLAILSMTAARRFVTKL